MTFEFVTVTVTDGVAVIVLDRPHVNAINQQMYDEIAAAFTRIESLAPGAQVAVLTARGEHFCAGNDLEDLEDLNASNAEARLARLRGTFWSIYDCDLPVIAAVKGSVIGAGVGLAASSDLIVAARGARFGVPEISVGVIGGASHLLRIAPSGLVRKMIYTADPVGVDELAPFGGITAVVPPEELLDASIALARRIMRSSPVGLRLAKRAMREAENSDLKSGYEAEHRFGLEFIAHPDSKKSLQRARGR